MTEQLANIDDLVAEPTEIEKVPMGEGKVFWIGSLTADDFVEWNEAKDSGEPGAKRNAAAKLIVASLVKGEKDATRIGTADMVAKFRKIKVAKSEALLKKIFKLNGISQKDEVAAKNA